MPAVSVLITTYNRAHLLPRALDSVLNQDFEDFEVIVADDCSPDETPEVMKRYTDPRVRYIRHEENMASRYGDKSIFRRFVSEQSRGEYFVWLCDDDWWPEKDLLSTQVKAMTEFPSLAFVQGSSVFIYPSLKPGPPPKSNEEYITNVHVPGLENSVFPRHLYPDGFLDRYTFLDLYASDPKNRNIVTGATLYRRSAFERAKVFVRDTGVKWQAGYELVAGAATEGDVYFVDRPCVATAVDLDSASYRGTQYDHLCDCLNSITSAFHYAVDSPDPAVAAKMKYLKTKMMHSILFTYVMNKIGYRLGWFAGAALDGVEGIFETEITTRQFQDQIDSYGIPLSEDNQFVLSFSDMEGPLRAMTDRKMSLLDQSADHWTKAMIRFPDDVPPAGGQIRPDRSSGRAPD